MSDGRHEGRAPYLPSGYSLDETTEPDTVVLRREDGSEVAIFGERASAEELERAAWEDHRDRNR